ncbi:MAG TPA: hypothetical protein VLH61_06745 [Bacteroidales bacterium]|nr:hypothetical protein [Bacteroidales bacterium]
MKTSYACAAFLTGMGFKHAMSLIFPDDLQAFLKGTIDWSITERIVIVREFPENRFTDLLKDTVLQIELVRLIEKLKFEPTLISKNSVTEEFRDLELLLIGTLNPWNGSLRDKSNALLRELNVENFDLSDDTIEILAAMLSAPDPATCYNALKLIGNFKDKEHLTDRLNLKNALTLKDFLLSNLQSFRSDALAFLTGLYPERSNWTAKEWKLWLGND